jgi:hypothetical protein
LRKVLLRNERKQKKWILTDVAEDLFFKPEKRLEVEAVFAERKGKATFVDFECKDYEGECRIKIS